MLYEELESPPFFVSNRRGVVFSHFLFPLPSLKRTLTLTLDWCNPAIATQKTPIPPKGTRNTNPRSAARSQDFAVPSFPLEEPGNNVFFAMDKDQGDGGDNGHPPAALWPANSQLYPRIHHPVGGRDGPRDVGIQAYQLRPGMHGNAVKSM